MAMVKISSNRPPGVTSPKYLIIDFSFTTVSINGKHILALQNFLNDENDEQIEF